MHRTSRRGSKEVSEKIPWNRVILEEFISVAMLTEDEERIIRTRVQGWSRVKQSMDRNISEATVDRIINRLKTKYKFAAKYSSILPENIDF